MNTKEIISEDIVEVGFPIDKKRNILKWFIIIFFGVVIFLLITLIGFLFWSRKEAGISEQIGIRQDTSFYQNYNSKSSKKEISDLEGNLEIVDGESIFFDSGPVLNLDNNHLYLSFNKDTARDDRLIFEKEIAVHISGQLHSFNDVDCIKESKFFGDYSAMVVTKCNMNFSIIESAKQPRKSYDNEKVEFSTVATKKLARFYEIKDNPWIAVSVPYFQITYTPSNKAINVVSPREDIVTVYTMYGKAEVQFSAEDLYSNKQKTSSIGPLTLYLTPTELTCEPPYKRNGSCTKELQGISSTTHNVINFKLMIKEQESTEDYPLLMNIQN